VFWAAHYVGIDKEYCHIERLTNLDQLPPTGFTICAFPLKVKGGSAGPARVVALIHDDVPPK
jgi:kynurenine formamidase